ncbi:MAG: UGSC family (seleno)protein, partial [Burkholderiales bacterium]
MNIAVDEFEFFLEKEWSDGLPVVTPTEARVQQMLAGTRRDPEEMIGNIPPAMEPATVRTGAIHAGLAGCKPEYLPVVRGGITQMLR